MKIHVILFLLLSTTVVFSGCKETPDYEPEPYKCECGTLNWQGQQYELLGAEMIRSNDTTLYSRRYYITANVALPDEELTHFVNTWIELPDVFWGGNYYIDFDEGQEEFTAKVDEFNLNDPIRELRQYVPVQGVVQIVPAQFTGGTESVNFQIVLKELNQNGNPAGPDITYNGSFTAIRSN